MGNLDGKKQPGLQRQARLCNWNSIKAIALAREWGSCQILSSPLTAVPPLLIHVPPLLIHVPPNCIIIKSDAAWNETLNVAGLGWIVEAEDRISAFSVPAHHVRFPLAAEALALREEIWKCRKHGLTRIRCESDSTVLVKVLKKTHPWLVSMGSWLISKLLLHLLNVFLLIGSLGREM